MTPPGKPSDTTPRDMIIVVVILFIAIIAAGIYFYQSQEYQIKDSVTNDLSSIATLKADQIAAWRGERLFDARGISSDAFFIEGIDHYLTYGDNESREKILSRFHELNAAHFYDNVLLVDSQGDVRLSLDPAITSIQPSVKAQINKSLMSGDAVLTDFYQMPGSHLIHLDVISPFLIKVNGSEKPVGAILLSIDPDVFLYPLVQSWPVSSKSAETLLVEREGDHVLFLNELRYRNNTALNLTIPISQTDVPAVMAVLGTTGVFEGKDYRGVDVISVLEPVPGSPWFMVAKVDTEEVFSGWRSSSALIIALVAGSIVGALVIVGLLWQRKQKNYYHSLYVAEAERGRAEAELAAALQKLKEAHRLAHIGTWDWVMENDTITWSEELYNIAGRDPSLSAPTYAEHPRVYTPASWDRFSSAVTKALTTGEPYNLELELVRPDGSIRWVIAFGGVKRDGNGNVIGLHGTLQDITERKRDEVALQQVNKQLNLLSSITRHDILNQLFVLKGYIELSREYLGDNKTLSDFLAKEEKAATTIEHQIMFTKDYQNLGVAAPTWQNVNDGIRKAMVALPMRAVHVEPDPADPEVYADPLFEKVFYNLINNTLKYGGDQMKTLQVSSQESDTSLAIVCEDDGVGISEEDKKRLFTKGFGKNSGLGLFLSREILSITGITITENGTPGKGARFEITVPKGAWRMAGADRKGN